MKRTPPPDWFSFFGEICDNIAMGYSYDLVVLDKAGRKYMEETREAGSFVEAFHGFLMKDRRLWDRMLIVYCKHKRSKDLKYMAMYDGGSGRSIGGESYRNILALSNGEFFHLTDDGFKRCLD